MNREGLDDLLKTAQAEGLLPATAQLQATDSRPWPLALLTALGAWLAALLLFVGLGSLLWDVLRHQRALGVCGALLIGVTTTVLRTRSLNLFAEQLMIACLMAGIALVSFSLPSSWRAGQLGGLMGLLVLVVGALQPQSWLRFFLGAAAAGGMFVALVDGLDVYGHVRHQPWLAWHVLLVLALGLLVWQLDRLPAGDKARQLAVVESLWAGWLSATLAGMALWAGQTFLLGAALGLRGGQEWQGDMSPMSEPWLQLGLSHGVSAVLALLGGLWLARRWPVLRQGWCLGVGLVLVTLALLMPTLGACLLVLALCAGTGRWRLATLAAVAAVWIVGAFYYALSWPLVTKALALVLAAVVLGALAWWGGRSRGVKALQASAAPAQPVAGGGRRWAMALGVVLVLVVVNTGIWQKEQLIRHGQPVFVPLAPVDPRSLMQGDFMRLNFSLGPSGLPDDGLTGEDESAPPPSTLRVVFKRDTRGIVSAQRLHTGQPLAADELVMTLKRQQGDWILVTDAFYFKEGEAERWAPARFGEFRVDAQGRALLVGLRGEGLKPL